MQSDPDDVRSILDDLRRLVRVLRETHGEVERGAGLSAAQLFVLQELAAEKRLSINEIAARTYTHQSSVSVVATKLEERKLIARSRSDDDARRVDVKLTAAGRAALRRAPRAPQTRIVEALGHMTPQSRRRLATSLADLLRAMGLAAGPAGMFFEDVPTVRPRRQRDAPRR